MAKFWYEAVFMVISLIIWPQSISETYCFSSKGVCHVYPYFCQTTVCRNKRVKYIQNKVKCLAYCPNRCLQTTFPRFFWNHPKICEMAYYSESDTVQRNPWKAPYVWVNFFKGKAQIKNVKTCGPSPWPTLTNSMSYFFVRSISIEKRR